MVTDLSNIRWLTGFTGSNGWALLTPDETVLVTDGRYGDQATAQMAEAGVDGRVIVGLSGAAMLDFLAAEVGVFGSVAFESAHVTLRAVPTLPEHVEDDVGTGRWSGRS